MLLSLPSGAVAQTTTPAPSQAPAPSRAESRATRNAPTVKPVIGTAPRCTVEGLDIDTFRSLLQQRFSALLGPDSEGVPGSFAAVEIKDAQATIANTSVFESGAAVTLAAHGGVQDGVVSILNDETPSPQFGADLRFHILGGAKRALQFDQASCDAMQAAIRKADEEYAARLDSSALVRQQRVDSASLTARIAKLDTAIAKATVSYVQDSLRIEADKLRAARDVAARRLIPTNRSLRIVAGNQRAAAYEAAERLLDVEGFNVGWWSFGVEVENTAFKRFDPAQPAASQLEKDSYTSRGAFVSYSWYRLSAFQNESRFLSLAAHAGWEDNLATLTKVELTDRRRFPEAPEERVSETKVTAYQGAYENNIETLRLAADYYHFLLPEDRGALHVFPGAVSKRETPRAYSLGLGVLLTARQTAKRTSFVNAEVFFNLTDLTDSRDSDRNFWARSDLGILLSFPITFAPRS